MSATLSNLNQDIHLFLFEAYPSGLLMCNQEQTGHLSNISLIESSKLHHQTCQCIFKQTICKIYRCNS
jgi:hypothetical protein